MALRRTGVFLKTELVISVCINLLKARAVSASLSLCLTEGPTSCNPQFGSKHVGSKEGEATGVDTGGVGAGTKEEAMDFATNFGF